MDFNVDKDYYRILQVEQNATAEEIKKAFFSLAKKYHPDTKKALHDDDVEEVFTEKYREINEAHRVLSDSLLRTDYNEARRLREEGTIETNASSPDSQSSQSAAHTATQHNEIEYIFDINELPPVIRSDKGMVFIRRKKSKYYIGEDGARYIIDEEGRIRRMASQNFFNSIDQYAMYNRSGSLLARFFTGALLMILRIVSGVFINYPLFISMFFVHPNQIRRIRQEKAYIGFFGFWIILFLCWIALLGHVFMVMSGWETVAGFSIAIHLLAAALLIYEVRVPYLKMLHDYGFGDPINDSKAFRVGRRVFVGMTFFAHLAITAYFVVPLFIR